MDDSPATYYSWRVRQTSGPWKSISWRTFPWKMTEDEARAWSEAHGAVIKRVVGSAETRVGGAKA